MERTRSFLAYFLPGVVLVAALLVGMTIEHDRRRSATMAYEESHVVREQQIFVARLCDSIVADVQVLARNARVRQLASGPSPGLAAAVGAEFADLAHYKRIYDQVRYLDDTGMEVVRVNHRGGRTSIVPADSLQSKADRYYVTMTMALDPGTIFASPLDLNIEHGVIEQPLLPMIRIGTPVADDLGRRRGMVIVNYRAAELLDPVRALKRDSASRMLMLDRDGFWLKGLDPSDEFGFMDADGGDRRMNARFPDAWRRMANDEAGAFELPAGFFAFTTLRPFGARWADMVSTRDVTGRETRPSSMDDYAWKLVSFTPREALTRDTRAFVGNLLAPGALVLLLFAAGAWRQAVAVARRREAERGLREANTELERRVAVRTTALQETSEALNAEIRERISAVLARRDLEQKLANTEGLRALGAVTAGIAHDFNNVLMPITGYAELAQFDTPRGSPASDHLDRVLKAADRAQELIEQILTFSGRRRLDPQFIDPPALLGEVAAQLAPAAAPHVALKIDTAPGLPRILADETRLHRALLNLGRNALQAMGEAGGRLTLAAAAVDWNTPAARLRITVADTGPGIEPDVVDHIFEPYFTTRQGAGGTGLGLATARKVITDHGGTLEVQSGPGQGTTFTILLPPEPPDLPRQPTAAAAPALDRAETD